jgi:hypothetical protein
MDPRLEQLHRGETGQAPDGVVHLPGRRAALIAAEEIAGEERDLLARLHAASDGRPEAVDEQARDARRPRPPQADVGLAIVEEEVPGLVDVIRRRSPDRTGWPATSASRR